MQPEILKWMCNSEMPKHIETEAKHQMAVIQENKYRASREAQGHP